ncbi:DNA-formamidopyrimidine glycosylase [Candidatus Saccharibacteria bacterium RIFCSPHIGHO2_12_FULL_47_16b]|nr:MAG: DNA-formamidopyrimidine glycosylase [Candidatus Saccharibacteria bacterium RIFCSPHIGHO2_12_FULL_47_16b]OGL38691.1 MAG: DNA-formamidopyrimidine glycosylase [Candidatus Saccharibacteria bacterium RIFCSPLOWO2_02_FULL_46_7]
MPELPEVETIRIGLAKLLPGLEIKDVWHDWTKSFPNAPADVKNFLIGAKVKEVRRRAKVLIIDLSTKYSLIIHLKMTGQLVFVSKNQQKLETRKKKLVKKANSQFLIPNSSEAGRFGGGHPTDSLIGKLPDKSTRVILTFKDGRRLFFNDQRKFGWMRLLPTLEIPEIDFMKKVGPEPLEDDFTLKVFVERLKRRQNSSIKAALLDQSVLAGVGNIYADESLWAAKIHPTIPVKQVSRSKLANLYEAIPTILCLAIEAGGSTDRNYLDAQGKKGSYLSLAKAFRKEGVPCPRCGTIIEKIRVAGRGTHICPKCQKLTK